MVSLSQPLLFILASLFVVALSVDVLLVDTTDQMASVERFRNAVALDGVTITETEDATSLTGLDVAQADLVIFSLGLDFDDSSLVPILKAYVEAGGSVLVAGGGTMSEVLAEFLGASSVIDDCQFFSDIIGGFTFNEATATFTAEGACSRLITSDFADLDGTSPSSAEYPTLKRELYRSSFSTRDSPLCLELDLTLDNPAKSCLVIDNDPSSVFIARSLGSGFIYFISDADISGRFPGYPLFAEKAAFFHKIYNNLLASLGATPLVAETPDVNVLLVSGSSSYWSESRPLSTFFTSAIPTAEVTQIFEADFLSYEWGTYDIIVLVDVSTDLKASSYLKQYASKGGVVLVTGQNLSDLLPFSELIGAPIVDCDASFTYLADNSAPFPDNEMCEAMLNGGWMDLRGLSIGSDFPDAGVNSYEEYVRNCQDISDSSTGASCFYSSEDENISFWHAKTYGPNGGVIAMIPVDLGWTLYAFNQNYFSIAYKNLQMYAGKQKICSEDNNCLVNVPEWSDVTWGIYSPACISWFAHEMPADEEFVTLALKSADEMVTISQNVPIADQYYLWDLVWGISSGVPVHIEFSFVGDSPPLESAEFTLVDPRTGVAFPCVTPEPEYYYDD